MSLTAQSPQPTLAWQFENSNVDSVTGLSPVYSTTVTSTTYAPTYQTGKYNLGMRLQNNTGNQSNTWLRYDFSTSPIAIDNGVTLMCWVNNSTLTLNPSAIVTLYDTTAVTGFANTLSLGMTTTYVQGYTSGAGTYGINLKPIVISGTFSTGVWYHLAVTFNSTSIVPYLNGVAGTSNTTATTGISFGGMRLGTYTNGYNNNSGFNQADCIIDDLRVYNKALTAAQIQAVYNAQGMPGCAVMNSSSPVSSSMTGIPLFPQLSSAAVASSVGAFSLRAVNGTTAKAVQVKRQSDNATQDFYADRLGNLLTAPVKGQTLANWLAGSTGNVITWYDQSLTSNNMTQATAANQPIISSNYVLFGDPAPNRSNFVNANIDLGKNNGSYSKSVWIYPNNIASGRLIASVNTVFQVSGYHDFGLVTNLGIYFAHGASTYTWYTNYTIPINTWSHLAVTYDKPNQTVRIYVNSVNVLSNTAYTVQFNAGDGLVGQTRIGRGNGNNTFGYIEYPMMFNSVLSQTDINTLYAVKP